MQVDTAGIAHLGANVVFVVSFIVAVVVVVVDVVAVATQKRDSLHRVFTVFLKK